MPASFTVEFIVRGPPAIPVRVESPEVILDALDSKETFLAIGPIQAVRTFNLSIASEGPSGNKVKVSLGVDTAEVPIGTIVKVPVIIEPNEQLIATDEIKVVVKGVEVT